MIIADKIGFLEPLFLIRWSSKRKPMTDIQAKNSNRGMIWSIKDTKIMIATKYLYLSPCN